MTITIHISSMVLGFIIGILLSTFLTTCALFGERWNAGFAEGWHEGEKYVENKNKENKNGKI